MTWLYSCKRLWSEAAQSLRVAGSVSVILATLVLWGGFYFTTGDRQARCAAAAHYEISKAVSDAVTTYTHSCDIIAASRNIRALSELSSSHMTSAFPTANQAMQDVWNVNSILSTDQGSIAVYFPNLALSVTKSQFKFSSDLSKAFIANYPGLTYDQVLAQDLGSWHSYYSDGFCYIVRSIQDDAQATAYIIAMFSADSVFSESKRDISIIGDDSTCLYASRDNLPDNLYADLLNSLSRDRQITVNGVRYYLVRNEFSNISLYFFTLVPMLSGIMLAIRVAACAACLLLLAVPLLLLRRFEKKRTAEKEAASMTPMGAQASNPARHYTLSGLTKTLLDVEQERDYRISQQCYRHLELAPDETCMIACFALLEDQERLFDQPKGSDNKQRPITPYFILNNMLQDLLYDRHTGSLCYCGGKYIAISNLLPGETEADVREILDQVVASARNYLYLCFVAVGPLYCKGYKNFHATLTQASRRLDYERLWWRSEKVPTIAAQELTTIDFYNRIGLLNSCILENNYVKADETFQYILRNCIPCQVNQVEEAQSRLQILLDVLLSLTGYPREKLPANTVPPQNVAACQEAGSRILQEQIAAQSSTSANPAKNRIRAISEYVLENYSDSDLGVGTIAARFGMNAAYLSRAFKDSTGTNLLEFIHRTRVCAAKKFLPDYPIKEVCAMVGFADTQSFVRIFRKYEAVTPAEYKRNCVLSNDSLPE